jgi:hypothetical protein
MPQAKPTPGPLLLSPADHTLILNYAKRMFGGQEGH